MTCKDCIHYEICSLWTTTDLNDDKAYEHCYGRFKDKDNFEEITHGHWIYDRTYYEADECYCSICNQLMTTAKDVRMNYCPRCGARMDKEN